MTKREKEINKWIDMRAASFGGKVLSDMPTEARINALMEGWAVDKVMRFAHAGKPKNRIARLKSLQKRLQALHDAEVTRGRRQHERHTKHLP